MEGPKTRTSVPARALLSALAVSAACGVSPTSHESPSRASSETDIHVPAPPGTLSFARDVAPIVFEHCAPCHRPGGSGPFPLTRYEEVARHAADVAAVTRSGFMPPWPPRPGFEPLQGERRLTAEQIGVLGQWVDEGRARGPDSQLPPPPGPPPEWQLGTPDLIAEMPREYVVSAEGHDVFRNFVIPIPATGTRYVRSVELRPDNPGLIHHATMWIDRTTASRRVDLEDPEPGYPSMDPRGNTEDPDGHFLGWTPGTAPHPGREDIAWRLDPGTDLVLQLHMLPTGKLESIRCRVGFFFADRPPTRVASILWLGSRTIDIPPGEASYVLEDSYELPVDVELLAFRPHAHLLAREMEGFATLPGGGIRRLFSLPWSFDWQENYHFRAPVSLPAGTTLGIRYVYDNSPANPHSPSPPRPVRYGPGVEDEMGDLWLQVLTRRPGERARLERDVAARERAGLIAGYEQRLRYEPETAPIHVDLARVLAADGRSDEALSHYRRALELRPDYATAHNNEGSLLAERGDLPAAIESFDRALRIEPGFDDALLNLGTAWLARGEPERAISPLERGLEIAPGNARGHHNLGVAFDRLGQLARAEQAYARAVELRPDYAEAHFNLGRALARRGRLEPAVAHLERVVQLQPGNAPAHFALGVIAAEGGDPGAAAARFRRVLELRPTDQAARARLHQALGELAGERR